MKQLSLANVVAYRRRYVAVIAAVTIGVAFLVATLFVTGSVRATLAASVGQNYRHADLVINPGSPAEPTAAKEHLVQTIKTTKGVGSALRLEQSAVTARLGGTEQTVLVTVADGDQALMGTDLVSGKAPELAQATIDEHTAEQSQVETGGTMKLSFEDAQGRQRSEDVTITGVRQASQDPGASGFASLQIAQATADELGLSSSPVVTLATLAPGARTGATAEVLVHALRASGYPDAKVRTPEQAVTDSVRELSGGVDALTWVLGAFAGIALVVTVLVVTNTFSVVLAQRTRELALLRTLGARRRQVRSMVNGEALVIGAAGGLLGSALGAGVVSLGAALIRQLAHLPYVSFGGGWIPAVVGLVVGLAVTIVASARPARAATRVAPLEALRPQDTVTAHSRPGTVRIVVGVILVALGAAALTIGVVGFSLSYALAFALAFLGGLVSFIGVLVLGTLLIPWAVRQLARPFGARVAGKLAGLNALRHPQRTAAVGTALLLGVTLVSLMLVGASSARATLNTELAKQYPVDLMLRAGGSGSVSDAVAVTDKVGRVSGVEHVTTARAVAVSGECDLGSAEQAQWCITAFAASPGQLSSTLTQGAVPPADGTIAAGGYTTEKGASSVKLKDKAGHTVTVPIDPRAAAPERTILMTDATASKLFGAQPSKDIATLPPLMLIRADASASAGELVSDVAAAAGVDSSRVTGALPIRVASTQVIDTVLLVVSALLAVAVVIALIGVSNTLSLSVIERTRENSLLRALGLTKRQLRGMLALEAALIAAAATVLGLVLGGLYGLAGATAALSALGSITAEIPWVWVLVVLVVAVGAAVLASVWPARRAARMSPVEGLAVE